MSDQWASRWGYEGDNETGTLTLRWTDEIGDHEVPIHPPSARLVPCEARWVTPARSDLICGRVAGHAGAHVSIEHWRSLGSVAE